MKGHAIGDRVRVTTEAGEELAGKVGSVVGYDPGAERLRYKVRIDGRQTPLWFAAEEIEAETGERERAA